MKMKKFLAGMISVAMLAASASAFAAAPSEYDGATYANLGLESDDPDGQIDLAVIAASDVTLGKTMYIEGSVYSNGTIKVIDGAGNTVDGLFISGTGNTTYTGATGEYTAEGYKIVDSNGTDETTTMYDSKPNYNGAIYDTDTSFECEYTDYEVPDTTGYTQYTGTTTASIYGTTVTVTEDTYFETLSINKDGLIIDATDGPVNIVIENFDSATDGYFTVLGDNEVNIYIESIVRYGSASDKIKLYTQKEVDAINNNSTIWWCSSDEQMKSDIESVNGNANITFYIDCDDSIDTIDLEGSRAYANVVTSKNIDINSATYIIGDFTVGGNFSMTASMLIWGTVCAPNSTTFIGQSATLYGQLHTYDLDMAGVGAIIYQSDSIKTTATETEDPAATEEPDESGVTLDIVEDAIYVVAGDVANITINHNGVYHWEYVYEDGISYSDGAMTDADGSFNSYYDTSGSHTADTATSSTAYLSAGQYYVLKAVSNDDSNVYDTVKIIVVASEADIPTATTAPETEPTEAPTESLPQGEEIDLDGVGYAYIFGYEPAIYRVDVTDEEGNVIGGELVAEVQMAPDDAVTKEQVAAMIMRLLDQKYNTTNASYELTDNIAQHAGTWYERGLAYLAGKGTFDGIDSVECGPVTRGEVAKLVAYGLNLSDTVETEFTDIADNQYKTYIEIMAAYGYMNGVSDTAFEPDRIMTRAEFCAMFNNIIGRTDMGLTTQDGTEVTPQLYSIVDLNGHWASDVMLKATSAYDEDGLIDVETRLLNIRNVLDNYDAQTWF